MNGFQAKKPFENKVVSLGTKNYSTTSPRGTVYWTSIKYLFFSREETQRQESEILFVIVIIF